MSDRERTDIQESAGGEEQKSPLLSRIGATRPQNLFADDIDEAVTTEVVVASYDLSAEYTGRDEVLTRLMSAFREVRSASNLSFLLLVGEPGMGKSRTIKELGRTLKKRHPQARMLVSRGDGSGVPYLAVARLLARRFGITPGLGAEDAQEHILEGVSEVLSSDRVTEVAHLLAHLMRVPLPDSQVVGALADSPQQLETRMFIALRRFLAADAGITPLVLVIEDMEMCAPETINLVLYLAAGLRNSPVMLVGTARDVLFERFPGILSSEISVSRIDLAPLSAEESVALARALLRPAEEIPDALMDHVKTMNGSPRAIVELIHYLIESHIIARAGSMSWTVDTARLAETALPSTYEELVGRRLDVMEPRPAGLLAKAAVIGHTFWLDAVVALVRAGTVTHEQPDGPRLADIASGGGELSRSAVAEALALLIEHEWIVPVEESSVAGEREYRFAYPKLRALVLDRILESDLRIYHKTAAQWLELRPEGREPVSQADIARHFEAAGLAEAAAMRYRRAADAARASYFNDRAIALYRSALDCLGDNDLGARMHIWHALGSVYELRGDFESALSAFERMLRLAWVVAARSKAAVAFNKMGRVWRRKGDLKLALEYLERGAELFEQTEDSRGISGSLDDIGMVLFFLGRYDEAYDKVTAALERRSRDGDPRSLAMSLSNLGNIQRARGLLQDARQCHQQALELRRTIEDRLGVVSSLNNVAVLDFEHGDYGSARAGWLSTLAEAEEIGAVPLAATVRNNLGELALVEGKADEARRHIEDALEVAEDMDDRRLRVEALRNLALLENILGQQAKAHELAHRSFKIAANAGLRDGEARALLCLGEVLSQPLYDSDKARQEAPKVPAAQQYFQRGIDLLRELGHESDLARGLEKYGRYRVERSDLDGGKTLLREALAIYTRLGMKRGQDEVEKLMATLH